MVKGDQKWNEQALKVSKKVVDLAKELAADDKGEPAEKLKLTEQLFKQGESKDALLAAAKALEAFVGCHMGASLVRSSGEGGSTTAFGEAKHAGVKAIAIKQRMREILWIAKDILNLARADGDPQAKGLALQTVAGVHVARCYEPDAPVAAIRTMKESLAAFREAKDLLGEATALRTAIEAHLARSDLSPFEKVQRSEREEALQHSMDAVNLWKTLSDSSEEATALHNQAVILLGFGELERTQEAASLCEEALSIYRAQGDHKLEVIATNTLINCQLELEGPHEAIRTAMDARADFQDDGNREEDEAIMLLTAANLHIAAENPWEGLRTAQESRKVYRQIKNARGEASALHTIMTIKQMFEETDEVLSVLDEMIEIFRDLGDKQAEASALTTISQVRMETLCKQVEEDATAEKKGDTQKHDLTVDDVTIRGGEALAIAAQAIELFQDLGDIAGEQAVHQVIDSGWNRACQIYTTLVEPTI